MEDFTQFFGEIIMKQLTRTEDTGEQPAKVFGKRIIRECTYEYDFTYLCENICTLVPAPEWPDADKEPLPPPLINSILKRPPNRSERQKITKFTICTVAPDQPIKEGEEEPKIPALLDTVTRWVLQPKETKKLFMKFFSKKIGTFTENLQFEVVGSHK